MLKTSDFDYELPLELIAQSPLKKREDCRMMHLNKTTKEIQHKHFFDILDLLNKDDILVLNDTKVYPARILAKRISGAEVEVFLLNPFDNSNTWEALMKNAKRVKEQEILEVNENFKIKLIEKESSKNENEIPKYKVELIYDNKLNVYDILNEIGSVPLPPYISRKAQDDDKTDYQTVFAKNIGSVAAPTAGLHFSNELLGKIKAKGVKIAYVTLNVGLGTFMPVKTDDIKNHTMHFENFEIPKETANLINNKKGNVIAVGTTVLRCLEATYQKYGKIIETKDKTDIFIYPPYEIKSIDKLITNFHLPKSTLIMLVSAFCTKDFTFRAYKQAVNEKYRFFSYGDCMFIDK
ncbi:MAG: tRNA preQ1(34) S-adenosylmethionine ribosyltransferase-isomerase QueA [Candidatus Gastranaerophilales bacterium]|nr:tRNA preQ1(34) S-adenosylmethionine ribosyltransferase-isomerase QueA [Candidatus Gastranaerophilales bacterium]